MIIPDKLNWTVQIRPMVEEDVSQVVEIDKLSFSLPWSERSYRYDLHSNPAARLWIAECIQDGSSGKVIGMVVTWFLVDEVHIGTIAIHPDYRRQGIGKQILIFALDNLKREGAKSFTLEVRKGNIPAQSLYTQLGFQVVGVRRRYYQDNGEDAFIMTLDVK